MFGGRTCELIAGHHARGEKYNVDRSGSITWFDVPPDEQRDCEKVGRTIHFLGFALVLLSMFFFYCPRSARTLIA